MSRFNVATIDKRKTTNRAGGKAFTQPAEQALVHMMSTSMLNDQHYRTAKGGIEELRGFIANVDVEFAMKATAYVRNDMYLRSITHVSAVEIARHISKNKLGDLHSHTFATKFMPAVVRRPDDMTEMLAYYWSVEGAGASIPACLKKGMANAFNNFDEYQLAKYQAKGKDVSLVDLANLVHPVPVVRNEQALKKLINNELRQHDTWEDRLSSGEDKADVWLDLLATNKLGYFALLRNLRNIFTQATVGTQKLALAQLVDPEAISRSMVLPFRFISAAMAVATADIDSYARREIQGAIGDAAELSLANVPKLDGRTAVVLDTSGSMTNAPHKKHGTAISPRVIGSMFAAALAKKNNADLYQFADICAEVPWTPHETMVVIQSQLTQGNPVGHGTNMGSFFDEADKSYDRIIFLSDMQTWHSSRPQFGFMYGGRAPQTKTVKQAFKEWKAKHDADPQVYTFDLAGLGSTQFTDSRVCEVSGFSDKVFDMMKLIESGDSISDLINAKDWE